MKATSPSTNGFRRPTIRLFIYTSFFLSGANGLVFEILFRRILHLSLGISHYSVGMVLIIFMTGLGIGGMLFGRIADRPTRPLLMYGILEAGIGLMTLLLLGLTDYLDFIYLSFMHSTGSSVGTGLFLKGLVAGILILPVTILMGGTLPALGRAVSLHGNTGRPVGLLYGINTLGGVAGTLGVTFFLVGKIGTRGTMLIFSCMSTAVGITALIIGRSTSMGLEDKNNYGNRRNATEADPRMRKTLLAALTVAGFVGLSAEIYWNRILAYVVGSHGFAFGIILAAFLAGLGIGSLLSSRIADKTGHPYLWVGFAQILIGTSITAISLLLYGVRGLAGWLTLRTGGFGSFIFFQTGLVFLLLFFPAFLMGSLFPLVIGGTARGRRKGYEIGKAYALNTFGSIAGAGAASFILIGIVGIGTSLKLSSLLSIAAGISLISTGRGMKGAWKLGIGCGAAAAAIVLLIPLHAPLQQLMPGERLIFYRESNPATVSVREDAEGGRMLSINGLDEVPVDPSSLLTFRVLAHMPLFLHTDPRHVMVLSLGGAVTTSSVAAHDVERIDAVELCAPVIEAARFFEPWNGGVLDDPALNVMVQDGRNHLLITKRKYDVITADATHPWSADSWILYTREFYDLILSRLSEGGLFCQWIPLHWLSDEDFRCILRTLRSAFPNLSLWYSGSYIIAVGSRSKPVIDNARMERLISEPAVASDLRSVGIESPLQLLSLFLMSNTRIDEFAGEGPLNTDDRPYLEHSAARCFGRETTPTNLALLGDAREDPVLFYTRTALVTGGETKLLRRFSEARNEMIRGRIMTYAGEFEETISHYRKALASVPEDGVTRLFLTDARKTYSSALASEGDERRRSGDGTGASELYGKSLAVYPESPRAHNGIGLLLYGRGKYLDAIEHFDRALAGMPNQIQIRYNKVLALLKAGMLDDARSEINYVEYLEKTMDIRISRQLRRYLDEAEKVY